MAMSSTSVDVIFREWTQSCLMIELSVQICAAAVAIWDFLTPPSVMTATLLWFT